MSQRPTKDSAEIVADLRRAVVELADLHRSDRTWRRCVLELAALVRRVMLATEPRVDAASLHTLDRCYRRLKRLDVGLARLALLRLFGGLSLEAAAEILGLSPDVAAQRWRFLRAWFTNRSRRG